MGLCKCGCGLVVKKGKRFVHGHHARIHNPMKNIDIVKKNADIRKGRFSGENCYWQWKKPLSDETRKKQSEKAKGRKRPDLSESNRNRIGNKNPCWKGGVSLESYGAEFNKELKEQIRKRDNHQCRHPNCTFTAPNIPVHHIDYDKNNNKEWNLICLCPNHHSRTTNTNRRTYWIIYYQTIMKIERGLNYAN